MMFDVNPVLICATMLSALIVDTSALTCAASDSCEVNCIGKELGPEAPNLDQIIPSRCHDQIISRLQLNSNKITTIPSNWLSGWSIKTLDLSYNPLSDIAEGAFDGHGCSLERLFLQNCSQLVSRKHLSRGVFQGLGCSLVMLNLDGTGIEDADLDALADLKYLEELHSIGNKLTTIGEGVLSHMKDLQMLFLEDNAIDIPHYEQPFEGMTNLSSLSLRQNRLRTASYRTFGQMPALEWLNIDENPLVCNCTIWWLKDAHYLLEGLTECLSTLGQCSDYTLPPTMVLMTFLISAVAILFLVMSVFCILWRCRTISKRNSGDNSSSSPRRHVLSTISQSTPTTGPWYLFGGQPQSPNTDPTAPVTVVTLTNPPGGLKTQLSHGIFTFPLQKSYCSKNVSTVSSVESQDSDLNKKLSNGVGWL